MRAHVDGGEMASAGHRSVRSSYAEIGGSALYSEVVGAGDPVLLLHGGFCSLESLSAQAEALADDYEVFAFERAGHGRSADVDAEYSYAAGVDAAVAYLDAQGLESVHVVGYSDGAIIGLLLAIGHRGRVRSLTAISANLDTTAFTWSPEGSGALQLRRPVPLDPPSGDPVEPDAERAAYDRLSPDGPAHGDVVLEKLIRLWTTEPAIEPSELEGIEAPTLVMAADRDNIRVDHSLLIASSIPSAQLCIVPGTTHALVAERPGLVSLLVLDFLRAVG
jgi:pimeloyl-ACP methyl ester carboxylesterase